MNAFVDIVGSTELAIRLGDRAWSELLDAFHASVHCSISHVGGDRVNTLGDGVLAASSPATAAVDWSQAVHHDARELGLRVRVGIHASGLIGADETSRESASTSLPVWPVSRHRGGPSSRAPFATCSTGR